jgi:hypothetical protein
VYDGTDNEDDDPSNPSERQERQFFYLLDQDQRQLYQKHNKYDEILAAVEAVDI